MDLYACRSCRERFLSMAGERANSCPACGCRLARVWMPAVPRAAPGSYPEGERSYASMDDFVREDPARLTSPEIDFGVHWRDAVPGRSHRAAWIEATGELYVVQAGPESAGGGHVEVLGVTDRDGVEAALAGWRDRCRDHASIAWIRRRARRLPQRPRRRAGRAAAVALGATLLALAGTPAHPPADTPPGARSTGAAQG